MAGKVRDASLDSREARSKLTVRGYCYWRPVKARIFMGGVPLMVVAKNETHYGHLAPFYVTDAIRAGAPRFGTEAESKIVPLR
jgi:hypothetical protein